MNAFFYPAAPSKFADSCLEVLRRDPKLPTITALPGSCQLNHFLALKMRSGDVLILFAANDVELNELLNLRNEFEDFRILLIMAEPCNSYCLQKANLLTPRFTTSVEDMHEITAVINHILCCDDEHFTPINDKERN